MKANLVEFTFPVSGKKVFLPRVSMATLALRLQRRYKRPSPPMETIDYGGGVKRKEFNYLHPNYKKAVAEWNDYVESETTEEGLKRLFNIELTKEQIKEVNDWKKANPGFWDEQDDDRSLWFENIGIEDEKDLEALIKFMTDGDPDPEETAETAENF